MTSEEKVQWVYLVVIVLTYVAYLANVLSRSAQGALPDVDNVPLMLGAKGIGIALSIDGRIVVEAESPTHGMHPVPVAPPPRVRGHLDVELSRDAIRGSRLPRVRR